MRRTARALAAWLCAAGAVALAAGCRTARPPAGPRDEGPIRTASPAELAAAIGADAALAGLGGKLEVGLRARPGQPLRSCRAVLAARSPTAAAGPALYVKGYVEPALTVFTLVSDDGRFWLHVPRERVVYTGPLAGPRGAGKGEAVPVDARDLLRALFLEPLGAAPDVEVEEQPETYVVTARGDGRVLRRMWIERRRLTVRREVRYDAAGAEELTIDRERWQPVGGRLRPWRVSVSDPATGATVLLDFRSQTLDPPGLGPETFRPRVPPDARVEQLGAAQEPR